MKKLLAVFLSLALLAALLPAATPTAAAASVTKAEALEWMRAQEGSTHGDGQCVYLVKAYYKLLVGWAAYGAAYEYQTNTLPDGWVRIPGGEAQPGDVLLYDKTPNNGYGHVALCESEYVTYHQNYNEGGRGGPTKRIANVRYDRAAPNYWGCIRPRFSDTPDPGPTGFYDVPKDSYFCDSVLWAVNQEITKGIDETHFWPDAACTRGQAVTFLWRANGCPAPTLTENPFIDVSSDYFYYNAVLWAVEQSITNGIDDTHFCPDAPCTRGQIVTFLWRSEGSPIIETVGNPFDDVSPEAYYALATAWAVSKGITNGMTQTEFWPDNHCSRAQIVTFLYRQNQG